MTRKFALRVFISLAAIALIGVLASMAAAPRANAIRSPYAAADDGEWTFQGRVYEGDVRDESRPLADIRVSLYGSNHQPDLGQLLDSTGTITNGFYALTTSEVWEFYNILETDPDGYYSVGATFVAQQGVRKQTNNWIQYDWPVDERDRTGIKFWDKPIAVDTATSTPSPTPTATPTGGTIINITLCAVEDAFVDEVHSATNYGADLSIVTGFGQGQNEPFGSRRALARFDLSWIPAGSQVLDAHLELGMKDAGGASPVTVKLYAVGDPWHEMHVTWDNQPWVVQPEKAQTAVHSGYPSVQTWDVRGLVQDWVDGHLENFGLELRGPEGGSFWRRAFESRHGCTPFCPRLVLTLRLFDHVQTPTPVPTCTPTATPTPTKTPTPSPTPTATPSLDLQVDYIEVTQAIQCKDNPHCADNSVPLIADKHTYARVYVKVTGSTASVPNVTANVTVKFVGGAYSLGVPLNSPITAKVTPQRAQFGDTLNFWLDPWVVNRSCVLEVEVNPNHTVPENNYSNNTKTIALNFVETPTLDIVPIWIRYTYGGANEVVDYTMAYNMSGYLENILPVAEIQWHYVSGRYVDWNQQIGPKSTWGTILAKIADMKKKDTTVPSDAHWYAMIPFQVPSGSISGYGSMPGNVAAGRVPVHHENLEDAADIMAHELGHNFNRQHSPCGTTDTLDTGYPYANARLGDYGWDPQVAAGGKVQSYPSGWVVPSNSADVMSYCQDEWISEYTYKGILNYRGTTVTEAESNPPTSAASEMGPYLFASGAITGAEADVDPWAVLERPVGFDNGPGEGPYRLRLASPTGETLFERHFTPETYEESWLPGSEAEAAQDELLYFYEVLPWNPETARVEVWQEERLVAERVVSAHAPVVELTAMPHAAVWQAAEDHIIEWQARDDDGDSLWFDVAFSRDGGETWQMVATRLQETRLVLDGSLLPGTGDALIRVFASDGVLTSHATSEPFAVERRPPTVVITSPQDGAAIPRGEPVWLRGYAYDEEDGQLGGEAMWWESDRDGWLGDGDEILTASLSPGWHILTLFAIDTDQMLGAAQVSVYIGSRAYFPIVMKESHGPEPPPASPTPTTTLSAASPTPTPTSTPSAGSLIFYEDFNDGDLAGWAPNHGTWTNSGTYMRGEYTEGNAWNMRSESGGNLIYEGTVNLISGNAVGLTFRSSSDGTASYDVILDAIDGVFKISKRPPYQVLASYAVSVERMHQYKIRVVANGSAIDAYLDGVKRLSVTDSAYSSGRFGVVLFQATAAYDNLKAWTIP